MSSPELPPGEPPRDLADLHERPLTVPLLIRGSFDGGLFAVLTVISLIFLCMGVFAYVRDGDPYFGLVFAGIATALGVPSLAATFWLRRQRQWLEVTLTGFVVSSPGGRRAYGDSQISGLCQVTSVSSEGNCKQRVVLEVASSEASERVECRYTVPAGQADPLAGFLERVSAGLADRFGAGLSSGARLEGQGWHLDARGLHRGRLLYRLDDISWAGFFDRHLCLWRGGEERPFLRLPQGSRNIQPLFQVLWRHISHRPGYDRPPDGLPLGRLLLERRGWGFWLGLAVMALSALVLTLAVHLAVSAPDYRDRPRFLGLAVACVCGVFIGLVACWRGREGWLRFHERGLRQSRGGGRVKELLYDEAEEVTWKRDQTLIFRPAPGLGRPTIRYRPLAATVDLELAAMRDLACRPLAARWAEQVPHGPLAWTPRLRFLPGGLEYRPSVLLMLGDPVTVPYPATSYRIEGEYFILLVGDKAKPACKERLSQPNFFVGLLLLTWIQEGCRRDALPDLGEHAPRPAQGEGAPPDARFSQRQEGDGGRYRGE